MACKTCGAPTGWVRGSDLERANESKRAAMADAVALRKDAERVKALIEECRAALAEELAKQKPGALSEGLGLCVLVNGGVVAWFAYSDTAEKWARENYFGRWLTWRAAAPVPIPLTDEEMAEAQRRGRELHAKIRVE